ncbi:branched-chain amino acid ABC transporter permease [Halalkalicoccus jeotgali]|uniref:Inner-membrane translocator n=1 Tax=Halalkalicoccus jeotgali (strain DSM 18796 / CECT 7217 / JCM 14584 / KCTC 4019 / B3) TaxID=795797 RepID=D8JB36_HALJB|nr:branched-chain amino acid ABC transporter permease [Halalkalicoccus jeotgali]ADJ16489.1 inner-membrane translocator [Halalkalicoccus jeotgali B3]ELY41415.1 inner-membrane translocator [Halalkalicoccus jeotgali B3]
MIESLLRATLLGLQLGVTLALVATGLTLIFGMMDVINFAHGALYMFGAYFGLLVADALGSFWLALVIAPLIVGAIGAAIEIFSLRPLYGRNPLYHILLTFGLAIMVQGIVVQVWGARSRRIPAPELLAGSVSVGPVTYPVYWLFVLVLSTVLIAAVWVAIERSDLGILMRASAHDTEMVDALGIDVKTVFTGVFVFGSVLAAVAGVLLGASRSVHPGMGFGVIIEAFVIVVIGGLGSFKGAIYAALLIGLVIAYGALIAPALTDLFIFALMATVLVIKPSGLFGTTEAA